MTRAKPHAACMRVHDVAVVLCPASILDLLWTRWTLFGAFLDTVCQSCVPGCPSNSHSWIHREIFTSVEASFPVIGAW
jgi:hypothetical protein